MLLLEKADVPYIQAQLHLFGQKII